MAKEIEEKTAQRRVDAPNTPFLATVTEAVLIDMAGLVIKHYVGPKASGDMLNLLSHVLGPETDRSPSLYCFDARTVFRIMALDAVRAKTAMYKKLTFWLRESLAPAPWADPCDIFINTALRNDIGLGSLCRFLDVQPASDELPVGALVRAELARQIAHRGGLLIGG